MNFKTAFLTSAAAAVLFATPTLAQEASAPATQDPAAAAAAPAQQSLSLNPGMSVRGPDGELGKLEGVQNNAEGAQELTVRDATGALKAVPLSGIRQDGAAVVVAYTKAEFDAATAIPGAPAAPSAAPAPAADPSTTTPPTDPTATEPVDPSGSSDPMAPPTGDQPN